MTARIRPVRSQRAGRLHRRQSDLASHGPRRPPRVLTGDRVGRKRGSSRRSSARRAPRGARRPGAVCEPCDGRRAWRSVGRAEAVSSVSPKHGSNGARSADRAERVREVFHRRCVKVPGGLHVRAARDDEPWIRKGVPPMASGSVLARPRPRPRPLRKYVRERDRHRLGEVPIRARVQRPERSARGGGVDDALGVEDCDDVVIATHRPEPARSGLLCEA